MSNKNQSTRFNKIMLVIAWILIAGGVIGAFSYLIFNSRYETTNDAQVDQYITPLSSRISGFIKEVNFEEYQKVKKGDTLIVIDAEEYAYAAEQAQSEVEASQSTVAVTENAVQSKASEIAIIQAQIEKANLEVWQTQQDYNRFKNLVVEKSATQQQFEKAEVAYKSALSQKHTLESQLKVINANINEAKAKVLPAKSTTKSKKASAKFADLMVRYSYIVAPFDGVVGKKNIQPGQYIKVGQSLVNVVSDEKWVTANFRETQISNVEIGADVYFTADAYPGKEFTGKIMAFSPASGSKFSLLPQNNATGNFIKIEQRIPTKIILNPNQETEKLAAGMNVMIHVKK